MAEQESPKMLKVHGIWAGQGLNGFFPGAATSGKNTSRASAVSRVHSAWVSPKTRLSMCPTRGLAPP